MTSDATNLSRTRCTRSVHCYRSWRPPSSASQAQGSYISSAVRQWGPNAGVGARNARSVQRAFSARNLRQRFPRRDTPSCDSGPQQGEPSGIRRHLDERRVSRNLRRASRRPPIRACGHPPLAQPTFFALFAAQPRMPTLRALSIELEKFSFRPYKLAWWNEAVGEILWSAGNRGWPRAGPGPALSLYPALPEHAQGSVV